MFTRVFGVFANVFPLDALNFLESITTNKKCVVSKFTCHFVRRDDADEDEKSNRSKAESRSCRRSIYDKILNK